MPVFKKNLVRMSVIIIFVVIFLILTLTPLLESNLLMKNRSNNNKPLIENPGNSISVLSANVGNLSLGCKKVLNKLCYKNVENQIAYNIQRLKPDIVALQEVLAPWQCEEFTETNKKKVCYEVQDTPQVRRLLGDQYTIVCNSTNQFECVGVKTSLGKIQGHALGEIFQDARTSLAIEGCDNGFNVSAVTLELYNGLVFDVVNAHPQSADVKCRIKMLEQIFYPKEQNQLVNEDKVLLMGDFNLDPWRDRDESAILWNRWIQRGWGGTPLKYHSGSAETIPPYVTEKILFRGRTVDIILSNFLEGTCQTLGVSPGTERLDGESGMDHKALFGYLTYSQ